MALKIEETVVDSPLSERFMEQMRPAASCEVMTKAPTLGQSIFCHILLLESVLMRSANRIAEMHDLTFPQWMALGCISHEGKIGITHSDLSRRLMLSKAPITAIVDRLEKAERVQRVADKHDRRVSRVVITPVGVKAWEAMRVDMEKHGRATMKCLSEEEQKEMLPCLARLLKAAIQNDPLLGDGPDVAN